MKRTLLVVSAFLAIILIWVGSAALLMRMFHGWQERAAVGDMFGAVGALFSGLALVGLVMTLYLQLDQLKVQSSQLKAQAQEINDTREEIKRERFENTFFQLLKLHSETLESVDITNGDKVSRGRDSFYAMYNELFRTFKEARRTGGARDGPELIGRVYSDFYRKHQVDLGQYFDSLYRLIKFVCASTVEDKAFYLDVIRAQLSTYEQLLLFYNCLIDQGRERLKTLVEGNGLLKDLALDKLLAEEHRQLYAPPTGAACAEPAVQPQARPT